MTKQELMAAVEAELDKILTEIQGGLANVPKDTGNLRQSIKVRVVGPMQIQLYIDEEQAPYAADINEHTAF